jgi:secondary thiamine-phosphate synthase enzyme
MAARTVLTVAAPAPGLVEITRDVAAWVAEQGGDGLLTLFLRHTSASLLVQENADPDVRADLHAFFRRLAPHADGPGMDWIRHRSEGPDDMPAHIKAAVLPVSLSVPVTAGRLELGRWQGLYLVEHRDRPRPREILLHFA